MRIELPLPTWSEAPRGQDDAHTLTLPPASDLLFQQALAAAAGREEGALQRVEVVARPLAPLTLTL